MPLLHHPSLSCPPTESFDLVVGITDSLTWAQAHPDLCTCAQRPLERTGLHAANTWSVGLLMEWGVPAVHAWAERRQLLLKAARYEPAILSHTERPASENVRSALRSDTYGCSWRLVRKFVLVMQKPFPWQGPSNVLRVRFLLRYAEHAGPGRRVSSCNADICVRLLKTPQLRLCNSIR